MAQFPSRQIAELSYRYRTLGLGFANIGGLLMASGIPYDSARGPRHLRRHLRHHDRRLLRDLGRDGRASSGPSPAIEPNARRHAARHPQPPPRRLRPQRRLREARHRAGAARPRGLPRRSAHRGRAPRLGPRHRARPEPRLPQRAGDRDRADRHDRPRHGLRHHRHRARLRAGEVQEARRRRLLQDHQPGRAGGARARSATARARSPRSSPTPSATARSGRRPRSTTTTLKAKGFDAEAIAKIESGLGSAFDIKFVFNHWTLGDEFLTETLKVPADTPQRPGLRPPHPPRLLEEGHRGRQRARVRGDDARRRAAPEARAPAGVRLRQPVRAQGQALPLGREPHPHDGGERSRSSRAPSPRPSTCRTTPPSRTARKATCCPGAWR